MSVGIAVFVFRSEWRRRIGWIAAVTLTIALGGGVSLGALIIAHRTDHAYPEYVDRADVGELTINPSISSQAMDARIRTLPGVSSVHSSSLLFASLSRLTGGRYGEMITGEPEPPFQVRGSTDGDFIEADRPVISSGRLPTGEREVFVADDARADLALTVGHQVHLGDTIPMSFWWAALDDQEDPPDPDLVVAPIGVEQLRVSGFGRLPDEILPDGLYARDRLIVSADVAEHYSCAFEIRPDLSADAATLQGLIPPDCATEFIYYSLELGDSDGDLTSVRTAYGSLVEELNTQLPPAVRDHHSYEYIAQTRADLDAGVRQTTRPTVAALIVFAIVAAMATLAVATLLFARNMRRDERDHSSMLAIGSTTAQRALAAATAPLVGSIAGLLGATLVATLISPIGPLGVVRDVDPSPGFSMSSAVMIPALAVAALSLLVVIGALALAGARRVSSMRRHPATSIWRARFLENGSRPSMTTGMRATLGSSGSWTNGAVLIGCVIAVAAVTSATIFGSNLSALATQPQRYGWPWELGVLTNSGYGFTDTAAVDAALLAQGQNATHSFYGFDPSIQVDGHPVPALYGLTPDEPLDFPIIDGRAPRAAGEAAVGTSTAEKFHIRIGDRVDLASPFYEPESVEIVGTVVLPALGAFVADRTGLGTGILVRPASPPTGFNPYPVSFTGISSPADVTADDLLRGLAPRIPSWDVGSGQPVLTFSGPVRPPEIVNVSDMRTAPLVLGGVLALSLVAGLALSTAVSVRERRREFAVLRTLGFSARSLYTSVWWQVTSTITIGLLGGIPIGLIAGKYVWSTFADQLGVVPRADVSVMVLVVIAAGALVLALSAAALPARVAARVAPSEVLRSAV